jgi:very-short-patch-repair endonuclease
MKCWVCGKEGADWTRDIENEFELFYNVPVRHMVENEHQRCYCKECYDTTMEQLKEENKQYILLRRRRMFEHALDRLERQRIDFYAYEEAIKTIQEYNEENDGKFDSSEEIIAAIILIHNKYHIKPQTKVGKYQADFMLPDDKVILEIDGERHKTRKNYDSRRDTQMKAILGDEWQIIRIPTDFIDTKAEKLPDAIEKVLDYRDTKKIHWRSL